VGKRLGPAVAVAVGAGVGIGRSVGLGIGVQVGATLDDWVEPFPHAWARRPTPKQTKASLSSIEPSAYVHLLPSKLTKTWQSDYTYVYILRQLSVDCDTALHLYKRESQVYVKRFTLRDRLIQKFGGQKSRNSRYGRGSNGF